MSFSSTLGILKNKITYPPPLTDKNLKNRLREKLGDYNSPTISYKSPSIGSNEVLRCGTETDSIIIEAPALPLTNTLNTVSMEPSTSPAFVEEDTDSESVMPWILNLFILKFCFWSEWSFLEQCANVIAIHWQSPVECNWPCFLDGEDAITLSPFHQVTVSLCTSLRAISISSICIQLPSDIAWAAVQKDSQLHVSC